MTYNASLNRLYFVWDPVVGAVSYNCGGERFTNNDNQPFAGIGAEGITPAGLYYFDLNATYIPAGTYRMGITAFNGGYSEIASFSTFIDISSGSTDTTTGGSVLIPSVYLITPSRPIITGVTLKFVSPDVYDAFITFTGSTFTGKEGETIVSYQGIEILSDKYGPLITVSDGVLPDGGGTYTVKVRVPRRDVYLFSIEVTNSETETNANQYRSLTFDVYLPSPPIDRHRRYWPSQAERAESKHICRCCASTTYFTSYAAKMRATKAKFVGCCCTRPTANLYADVPRVQDGPPCSE